MGQDLGARSIFNDHRSRIFLLEQESLVFEQRVITPNIFKRFSFSKTTSFYFKYVGFAESSIERYTILKCVSANEIQYY